MIKILNEEPVTLITSNIMFDYDEDKDGYIWIFKNPTESEIDEAYEHNTYDRELRILIDKNNNLYIAPSDKVTHFVMMGLLRQQTHFNSRSYVTFIYNKNENKLHWGIDPIGTLDRDINIWLQLLLDFNIVNRDTTFFWTTVGKELDKGYD